jgi:hypothetical protein
MTHLALASRLDVAFYRTRRMTTMTTWMRRVRLVGAVALGVACVQVFGPEAGGTAAAPATVAGQAAPASASTEKTVWYFYTVTWGKQEEFLDLFQKNHWPVLKAQLGSRLTSVKTYVPTYHGDGRADWTFAVAITFKDVATQTGPSPEAEIVKKLFKDQATFRAEEKTRFELLEAHWDVPLNEVNFESRQPAGR